MFYCITIFALKFYRRLKYLVRMKIFLTHLWINIKHCVNFLHSTPSKVREFANNFIKPGISANGEKWQGEKVFFFFFLEKLRKNIGIPIHIKTYGLRKSKYVYAVAQCFCVSLLLLIVSAISRICIQTDRAFSYLLGTVTGTWRLAFKYS